MKSSATTISELVRQFANEPRDIAVIVSRYNASVTDRLRDGAIRAWKAHGWKFGVGEVVVIDAPGAFELTALSAAAAEMKRFVGVVALGCLIKGDTRHDEYIAHAVANGLTQVTVRTGVPVAFGVITALNARQARERAGGKKGNKGEEAMHALLDTLAALKVLRDGEFGAARGAAASTRPDKARMSKGTAISKTKRKNRN